MNTTGASVIDANGNEIISVGSVDASGNPVTDSNSDPASNVVVSDGVGNGVVGSSYDSDKTVASASSTREAIATGATSIEVYNQGATNFMRFRFGDSTVDATITTGFFVAAGERLSVPVPGTATHWAYIADTADVTASVVWGG